jgi:hypothetical protein
LDDDTAAWHEALVRLSRPRVLLRLVLLLVGAGFVGWRAWETELASRAAGLPAGDALLLHRVAAIELLLALLALGAAGAAGLALRRRVHRRRLGLADPRGPVDGAGPPDQ